MGRARKKISGAGPQSLRRPDACVQGEETSQICCGESSEALSVKGLGKDLITRRVKSDVEEAAPKRARKENDAHNAKADEMVAGRRLRAVRLWRTRRKKNR